MESNIIRALPQGKVDLSHISAVITADTDVIENIQAIAPGVIFYPVNGVLYAPLYYHIRLRSKQIELQHDGESIAKLTRQWSLADPLDLIPLAQSLTWLEWHAIRDYFSTGRAIRPAYLQGSHSMIICQDYMLAALVHAIIPDCQTFEQDDSIYFSVAYRGQYWRSMRTQGGRYTVSNWLDRWKSPLPIDARIYRQNERLFREPYRLSESEQLMLLALFNEDEKGASP